ncbi:MAG: DUF4190 domain-containing protein [Clostridia bacterium]|nr:DUF4190 domain-containing protein [Clostridia bacterium]
MICSKCNYENNDGTAFCVNCGAELNVAKQEAPKPAEPAPVNQPVYTAPAPVPQKQGANGMSVAALVCGLLGIIGSFIPIVKYFTLVLAVLGIIFGVIGKKKAAEAGNSSTGLATAGLVLGVIGTAFSAVGVICALACVGAASAATETAGLDLLSSAKEAVTEAVTSAANEISSTVSDAANSIASSAADEVNSMASSAADKAAEAASSAAKDFVNSLFS